MTLLSKSLPRRTALKGLGATLALPFLDAMLPASSLIAAAKPVNRFQAFYVPNGMAMEYWSPKTEGSAYDLTPILEPLAPYRNQMLVLSGLKASWNYIHAGASGSFLTGTAQAVRKNEIEIFADVSIDQLLARHFASETQLASLELSMDVPANAGACTGNLSCAYTHTLSWRSKTQPLPMEWNPRAVFERLFGDSGRTDRGAREARLQQHKSILDSVTDKLASLRKELGPGDQVKVNEYADAVRDVERRIQRAEERDIELPALESPQGAPPVFEDHLALMLDLQLLAFQSDLTRVISFMISKEQSARPYPQIGVPEAHHPLSHHNNVPELVAKLSKINRYHAQLFAQYLGRLRATPDGDGSLLDHMMILYGAGISNSQAHSGDNLPLLVVGGGAGRLPSGRHIKYAAADRSKTPSNANLLVTLMDKMGVPVEQVGSSTGQLSLDTLSGL